MLGHLHALTQTHGQPSHELEAGEEDTERTCNVTFYCQDATGSVRRRICFSWSIISWIWHIAPLNALFPVLYILVWLKYECRYPLFTKPFLLLSMCIKWMKHMSVTCGRNMINNLRELSAHRCHTLPQAGLNWGLEYHKMLRHQDLSRHTWGTQRTTET